MWTDASPTRKALALILALLVCGIVERFIAYDILSFVYYLASGNVQWALSHLLFLQGDGHFWTIPQEMLFYLLAC